MKITTNKFVSVTYDLNVGEGDERELMEQATVEKPLQFIFGMGSMLPAFENEMRGLAVEDTFQFTLTPDNAYGEYYEENVVELPKNVFEVDGKINHDLLVEGNTVPMIDESGQMMNGSILEVQDDLVVMDFNHPLAGETLHFTGKVIDVHEATAEEIAAVNAMMQGGCSCGCGCDSDCECECDEDCDCGCNR
ncbi:MAG: FKBP-type peptidyl-prolyl cis-trans isomerase [Tannerella sp.]|jgi:FKBP-type peptidyl-prolyl cis-trans isomerase SlyD|nr:FKBP-type peptidyl-prolyl cis-trans isomerase [Tannerella sp.]